MKKAGKETTKRLLYLNGQNELKFTKLKNIDGNK